MAASVLFDAPGPRTRARHRVYGVISTLVLAAILGAIIWKLWEKDQFAYRYWEPFVTPRIINVLLEGLYKTVGAAIFAVTGAVIFGVIFGIAKLSDHRVVRWPAWVVVEFFRAVPLLMVIIATWYYLDAQPGTPAFVSLVVGLILYNGSVLAEIVRAGINAVPSGQAEAAYALGMRKGQVTRIVLLPQAIKIMIPAIISQAIVALKDTSLGYAILAPGLTVAGKLVYGEFRNTIQTALVMAAVYIVLNLILSYLATLAQRRFVGERKGVEVAGGIVQSQPGGTGSL